MRMKFRFRRSRPMFPAMPPRTKQFLLGGAALVAAIALPAIAQDRPESILPPGFGNQPAPAPEPTTNNSEPASSTPAQRPPFEGSLVDIVDSLTAAEELPEP